MKLANTAVVSASIMAVFTGTAAVAQYSIRGKRTLSDTLSRYEPNRRCEL